MKGKMCGIQVLHDHCCVFTVGSRGYSVVPLELESGGMELAVGLS